jgi:alpha-galactosidase
MNRRHFVRSTGLSLGALLIGRKGRALPWERSERHGIKFPDEVSAISDVSSFPLQSNDGKTWTSRGTQIHLSDVRDAVAVDVHSQESDLRFIILTWKCPKSPSTACLGDQWERSYGDLHWAPIAQKRILPWYFLEYDGMVTNGFGVKTGCRSMCFWQAGTDRLLLTIDVRSGGGAVRLGDRILRAAEIVTREGIEGESPFASARAFCAAMCESPRLPKMPVYGLNDWYFTYGNNSAELILEHADLLADLAPQSANTPFCVIDAGWAKKSSRRPEDPAWADDYQHSNAKFPDMASLAEQIRRRGMRPGIWVRPLCGGTEDDRKKLLPPIPGREDPTSPVLDPTIPENIEKIRSYFTLYPQWGYDLIKHDYSTWDVFGKWGFQMVESRDVTTGHWRFNDSSLTNAEVILNLYRAIREAAGATILIGCNTISHLSAGLFELQRIGDDTSGVEWERTRKMGVNTLGFRIPQHRAFYAADPDCVGLTTQVPWEKNTQWMRLVAESGTPLFISAQKEAVGEEQRAAIRRCLKTASESNPAGEPLDWLDNQFPRTWRLLGREVQFDWF